MRDLRHVRFAAFAIVLLAYIATRFWDLTASCLWFDEIFSIHAAEHSWTSLFQFVAADLIHPPLFYVLLKLWITVGGESLFWLRLFPVTLAILSLVPFLLLCRELKLRIWTQVLALFFLTTNGALIKYSQEVRMYSLLICISLFSIWLFARSFRTGKSFVPLVLVNVLLIYTHYFGWFVIASEVTAVIIFQRVQWRRMLAIFAMCFICFVPWAYAVWNAADAGSQLSQNIGWMRRPGLYEAFQFVLDLLEPFYYQASSIDPPSIYRISVPLLLIVFTSLTLYWTRSTPQEKYEQRGARSLVVFALLPLVLAFVASWLLPYSIWGTRHLIIVFAPFFLLLSIAITRASNPAVKTAAITLILLLTGYAFVLKSQSAEPNFSWCKWEFLIIPVMNTAPANIYVFEDDVAYHIWYDLRHNGLDPSKVVKIKNIEGVPEDPAYFLPRGFGDVKKIDYADLTAPKFWIAYRAPQFDEAGQPLKTFLERGYSVKEKQIVPARRENAILVLLEK
jgi:uncharacterized membrane protein